MSDSNGGMLVSKKITASVIITLAILILSFGILSLTVIRDMKTQLMETTDIRYEHLLEKIQETTAGLTYAEKRKFKIISIRDIIIENSKVVGISEAYKIAEINYNLCEKYEFDIDLLIAIQYVESRFDNDAISPVGSIGINQIYPSTGRLLCRMLDWEYSKKVLQNPEKNTILAVMYLDMLINQYETKEIALAEYNGGPRNAYYYKTKDKRLAEETSNYVKRVVDKYTEIKTIIQGKTGTKKAN